MELEASDKPTPTKKTSVSWFRMITTRMALVLLSTLVTLVALECVFQALEDDEVALFFTPFVHDDSSFKVDRQDPEMLYTLAWYVPGKTGITGSAPVRINNLGLRDDNDYPVQKPENCYRILGIGDSMTFGKGVAENETYLGVLEKKLTFAYEGRCIEVLNAGMPNTNFFIQWTHYIRKWHTFKPDLILWGIFVYNDTQLQDEEEPYSQGWMEFVDHHDWLKASALVRWAYHRAFFDLGARSMNTSLPRYYDADYAGWNQFRNTAAKLAQHVKDSSVRVAVALVPIPEGYDEYPYRKYHEQLTRLFEKEHGLPVVDLVDGLRSIKARKHWVHPSDGHPDAFVHGQMADYLMDTLPWGELLK